MIMLLLFAAVLALVVMNVPIAVALGVVRREVVEALAGEDQRGDAKEVLHRYRPSARSRSRISGGEIQRR